MTFPDGDPLALIRKPERVADVRQVWASESGVFTPWLAENLDLLDLLGLGRLTKVDTEVSLPGTGRALDILAETPAGQRVAIENQFSALDHDHLTRGLAYAVGLSIDGGSALVVIAESHRPEFVAVADYLNLAAEALGTESAGGDSHGQGIGVFLIELSVERLDRWYIPRLQVVARPNAWLEEVARTVGHDRLSGPDAFLEQYADPAERALPAAIVARWSEVDGSTMNFWKKRVTFRIPRPAGKPVAVFTAGPGEKPWLNRGALLAAASAGGVAAAADIDAEIDQRFPDEDRGQADHYVTLTGIAPDEWIAFAGWAIRWLADERMSLEPGSRTE